MTYLSSPFKVSNVAAVPSEFLTPFKYLSSPSAPRLTTFSSSWLSGALLSEVWPPRLLTPSLHELPEFSLGHCQAQDNKSRSLCGQHNLPPVSFSVPHWRVIGNEYLENEGAPMQLTSRRRVIGCNMQIKSVLTGAFPTDWHQVPPHPFPTPPYTAGTPPLHQLLFKPGRRASWACGRHPASAAGLPRAFQTFHSPSSLLNPTVLQTPGRREDLRQELHPPVGSFTCEAAQACLSFSAL